MRTNMLTLILLISLSSWSQIETNEIKNDTIIPKMKLKLSEHTFNNFDSALVLFNNTIQPKLGNSNSKFSKYWYEQDLEKKKLTDKAVIILHYDLNFKAAQANSTILRLGLSTELNRVNGEIIKLIQSLKPKAFKSIKEVENKLALLDKHEDESSEKFKNKAKTELLTLFGNELTNFGKYSRPEELSFNKELNNLSDLINVRNDIRTELNKQMLSVKEGNEIKVNVLHTAFKKGKYYWSDQITQVKKVLFVIIDKQGDLIESTIRIEDLKSSLSKEFKDLITILKELNKGAKKQIYYDKGQAVKFNCRIFELKRWNVNPPGNLFLYTKDNSDTIKFEVFEKPIFSIKVGLSAAQIVAQDFKLDGDQLTVSLDSARRKVWEDHLFVGFNFHPGRFLSYRSPQYDPRIFNYSWGSGFMARIGLWGGFNLSLNPLDNLYTGISYDLARNFTINWGCTWNNMYETTTIDVGDISTVKDALKLSNKSYAAPQMFWGISFSPSYLVETVGLWKDNKKENN